MSKALDTALDILRLRTLSPHSDAFSAATLKHHMALQEESIKDHQWHREQVQRRDRAKYFGGCTPESWCPAECEIPCVSCDEENEGVDVNFLNSPVIGDDALAKLAKILKSDEKPEEPDEPQPEQPATQPRVIVQPWPPWLRTLLTLLAVLLGAIIVLWAYSLFGADRYELIAEPFQPPSQI